MGINPSSMPFGDSLKHEANRKQEENIKTDIIPSLEIENLLLAEYNFSNVMAYQNREQSRGLFNIFVILLGIVVSAAGVLEYAIFSSGLAYDLQGILGILLLVFSVICIFFYHNNLVLKFDFDDSIEAMKKIRHYYFERISASQPSLLSKFKEAFHWDSLPVARREWGGSSFIISIAIISMTSAGFSTYNMLRAIGTITLYHHDEIGNPTTPYAFFQSAPPFWTFQAFWVYSFLVAGLFGLAFFFYGRILARRFRGARMTANSLHSSVDNQDNNEA